MARGRILNQSISVSRKFHELPDDTCRLFATWMIPFLDKRGVFFGDPATLRSFVFPRRSDISVEMVARYLSSMEDIELIVTFEARKQVWVFWPGFSHNQSGYISRELTDFPEPPNYLEVISNPDEIQIDRISSRQAPEIEREREIEREKERERGAFAPPAPPAAIANQPAPPRKPRQKAEDPNRDAAPVKVYVEVFKRYPNPRQAAMIAELVDDLPRWKATLEHWDASGWKSGNIPGMIDSYRKPSTNGKRDPGARRDNGRTFRRAQVPDSTPEHRDEVAAAARYRIQERAYCKAHGLDPRNDVIDRKKVEALAKENGK